MLKVCKLALILFFVLFNHIYLFTSLLNSTNSSVLAIYQGPWFSLDGGRMKRDLTYEIEHQDLLRKLTH